ncbi:MAG: hypothetical protein AVDCRST_MAG56-3554 [uncultured Cytophagales bacterium]|uniref:Uncharacterized protein n=1 Tax=uncultured Cytophagales bacterium TaxID=158755 RepID=A0A6J4JEM9_9SPHI|nr:MAG: hypothetical protein AVDCRST_MAG56-3554 [uncultured Cytophagales bacterium]
MSPAKPAFSPSHPVVCPVDQTYELSAQAQAQLAPLLEYLQTNALPPVSLTFPIGTLTPAGTLDLCKQNLGPQGALQVAAAVRKHEKIRHLLLGTNGVGDAGAAFLAAQLADHPTLQTLYLGCNYIQPHGLALLGEALAENTSIEGLWLKRNPFGRQGVDALVSLLQKNRTIRILDLVNTGIGVEGVKQLADVLQNGHNQVQRLYLGGNQLTPAAAVVLGELLRNESSITALLLNVNQLGDEGAFALAAALRDNATLTELGLASNGIGPEGAKALVEALLAHPAIRHLDLGYSRSTQVLGARANQLTDPVAVMLGQLVSKTRTLQSLNVVRHQFSEDGLNHLCRGLAHNTSLRTLSIDGKVPAALKEFVKSSVSHSTQADPDVTAIRSVYR